MASQLIQKLRDWVKPKNEITESVELEKAFSLAGWFGGISSSGIVVNEESAMRHAAVNACIRILSQTTAFVPCKLYKKTQLGKEELFQSPLYKLLHDSPNEWQTAFEFKEFLLRDLLYKGNSYVFKVPGIGDRIQELIRINPGNIAPKQNENTLEVTYELNLKGNKTVLTPNEVLHLRGPSLDGLTGLNPIALHRETIGYSIALREHGAAFFKNGAKPLGLLKQALGTKMEPAAKGALIEDFKELHSGANNAHQIGFLPAGIDYTPVKISMEDSQYIDAMKFAKADISSIFGVPLHKLSDLDRATFSNIEHQHLEFLTESLLPIFGRLEQTFNKSILGNDPTRFYKFYFQELLRADIKSRSEAFQIQRRNGVINANEWRQMEDYNLRSDAEGEAYIVEANMTSSTQQENEPNE